METKISVAFFLLLFLTVLFPLGTVLSQDQLEENTLFTIEVRRGGSATWVIERRFLLKTDEDVTIFEQYMLEFENQSAVYLEEFRNKTYELVNRASDITGRNMSAENFGIDVYILETVTDSYGVIKYQFDWISFANIEDKRITIGDVFEGGFYLYEGDTLIIKYPSGYVVVDVRPEPDGESDQMLMWYGRRNFMWGEPNVSLEERTLSVIDILQEYALVILGLIVLAPIGSACLWFFKFRKKEKVDFRGRLPRVTLEIGDDEDKVVALLKAAGGRLYQSTITKKCGFSKSKTSDLLTSMENKGIVRRHKKGREKLVTLIED